MLKLFKCIHGEFKSIFCAAVGHPLQHHLICLYSVTNTLLHHYKQVIKGN